MRAAEHSMATCLSAHVLFFSAARASLVAHMVKNLPAMQETQVRPLSQEDPLKKEMATYSSILFLPRELHSSTAWSLVGNRPWNRRVRHD